jgi:hypothetical protein
MYGQPAHNRTVYAAPAVGGLGFRSARPFRFAPFPRLTPAPFASPGLATQALIRADKPSYTAGTLGAIIFELVPKLIFLVNCNLAKICNSLYYKELTENNFF